MNGCLFRAGACLVPAMVLLVPGKGLSAPAAQKKASAAPKRSEHWFNFSFQGTKVGFLYARDEPDTLDGRPVLRAHRRSVMTVRRQAQVIRMESTTDSWFGDKGQPIRFRHRRHEGDEVRTVRGDRKGQAMQVVMNLGGREVKKSIPLGKGVYLASSLDVLFNQGLRPKKKMRGHAILEEEGERKAFLVEVRGQEKTDQGLAYVIHSEVAGLQSRSLVTAKGRVLRVSLPLLGAEFVATTRAEALQVEKPLDIFSSALFSVPEALPAGDALRELVVRLAGRSGRTPTHVRDQRQRAKTLGKGVVELRIGRDRPPSRGALLPIRKPEVQAFLQETPYEALKDPRLVRAASKVVGKNKNAWDAARAINAFVHRHITNKSLARAFATAAEALESKEGDCTEHSVLFSALAKISGIPTRLVTGLVYVGGSKNVFGYHEWVEVWLGQAWVAMDPTFGQDVADPTHIKLTQGQSDADGLRDAGMVAASLIGDLELEVVEYTTRKGKKQVLK